MLHYTIVSEDTIVVAQRIDEQNVGNKGQLNFIPTFHGWQVKLCDSLSGVTALVRWTDPQFAAVLALMTSDLLPAAIVDGLYDIAEPLFEGLPREVRCIP